METAFEYLPTPHSYQQEVLQEMYESEELFNEGLPSFEYLLYMDDEELDYFLGRVFRSVAKAAGSAAKAAGGVAKTVGKGLSAVDKIVPISVLTSGLAWTPVGMAVRAGLGAAQAAASGKNVLQGAVRSLASTPVTRFYVDTALAAARGENVLKAVQKAAQGQIGDFRQSLQFAAMVAPFVPGLGTGVAAALGAANALAAGQPINDALIAAARSAIPGGAVAQIAFDTATNLAKGKNIGESLLSSARAQIPGGPAAQAAFDAAVALAKGKNIQDAAFAATGRLLPPSPYAADALSFVKKVASGQNIQKAALSTVGSAVLNKIEQQAGPIISRARAAVPIKYSAAAAGHSDSFSPPTTCDAFPNPPRIDGGNYDTAVRRSLPSIGSVGPVDSGNHRGCSEWGNRPESAHRYGVLCQAPRDQRTQAPPGRAFADAGMAPDTGCARPTGSLAVSIGANAIHTSPDNGRAHGIGCPRSNVAHGSWARHLRRRRPQSPRLGAGQKRNLHQLCLVPIKRWRFGGSPI